MFTKFVYELCERWQFNIFHKNSETNTEHLFSVLFIRVSLLPECNQRSVRNVKEIASVHQRECDWCTNCKSQWILGDFRMYHNECDILEYFQSWLRLCISTQSTDCDLYTPTYFQNIKCILFYLFLAFCNLTAWARFCESYRNTILQFLRALLLMACNKPHRIFPLGEKKL